MSAAVQPWQLGLAKPTPSRIRSDEVARTCTLPNGAQRVEIYGFDGRLHRSEEPDGSVIVFRYDIEGDLRSVEHSSGERVTYDGAADRRILRSQNDRCETTIEFDGNGFPSRMIQRVDEFEWTVEYRRDEIGRVTGCLYPQAPEWLESKGRTTRNSAYTEVFTASRPYFRVTVEPQEHTIAFADGTRTAVSTGECAELQKIVCSDARDELMMSFTTVDGRLVQAGSQSFAYDDAGRLASCTGTDGDWLYDYDESGHLVRVKSGDRVHELFYDHAAPIRVNDQELTYDLLGRRTVQGDTTYRYNFLGQLTDVTIGEDRVRYVYDGFGRLVAREHGDERVYYIVDFEGHRIAEASADGKVRRSYLWQGTNCVAEIEGVIGEPLARTLHRSFAGRLYAIGHSGEILPATASDPYGVDQIRDDGIPTLGSLFSDPRTRLFHAGSRWFDPATAQFLSPDGWFGTDTWNHLPQPMRSVLDALPGGTNVEDKPENAYTWCRYDPINYSDPNGHSALVTGLGIAWSVISFFLWQMQVTSIAFKMAALNFIVMIIPSLIDLIASAGDKTLWSANIFNSISPIIGSSRLMVPWAFPLNSIYYSISGTPFTMGSVIWMNGSDNRRLNETAKRDILVCSNASSYLAATNSVAADIFAVTRPTTKCTGTMNATANQITGITIDPSLAPATLQQLFLSTDSLGVRVTGVVGKDEFLGLTGVSAANIDLKAGLPNAFQSQPVDFFRLDRGLVKIEKDGRTIARSITFIRKESIHYSNQLPDDFATSGLTATEYLFKEVRKRTSFTGVEEFPLIEFSTTDINSYTPGDFLSILSGSTYFGRKMERKQGTQNVVLDVALPANPTPPLDPKVEVSVMTPSAEPPANNQSSSGDKITVDAMRTLRKHHGLTVAVGAGPIEDRRIVLQTFLRCTVDALPATLQGKDLKIDLLLAGVTTGNGTVTAVDTVTVASGQAKAFKKDTPVRITTAAGKEFLTLIKAVTTASETIQLTENLPAADFPTPTPITIVSLEVSKKDLLADPVAAAGVEVDIKSDDLATPTVDTLLRVKPASGADTPVVRKVKGDPLVVAQIDSATTNAANLTVTAFFPDAAKTHKGVAKKVVLRLTPTGGPHPFAQNDEIYCSAGSEEYIGKNLAAPGGDVILEDPITTSDFVGAAVVAELVAPTGQTTADAKLDQSLVAIPSDPDEDPVTRSRAVQLHEMRHVWQYAVLGPFFFSQPLPWLFRLGFPSVFDNKYARFFSTGGLEKAVSYLAWGSTRLLGLVKDSAKVSPTLATGTVTNNKRITLDAAVSVDDAGDFAQGAAIEVTNDSKSSFNIVDRSEPADRRIDLRFKLEDEFTVGSAVRVSINPFEKVDSTLNGIFNLTAVWEKILPRSWSHLMKGFMNQENWFPFLGVYPIAFARAGLSREGQKRVYLEQDAAFQSGDLYSSFGVSYPNEVFVGEFSRVLAFIHDRANGEASGLSDIGARITSTLTVEPQFALPANTLSSDFILGSFSLGALGSSNKQVRFRKDFMLPMNEKVENAIGAMFLTKLPGQYKVFAFDEQEGKQFSLDDVVDPALWLPPVIPFFANSFNELRIIKVKPLVVTKEFTAADPLFETETTTFEIKGAEHVTYSIDYKGAPPAPRGDIDPLDKRTFTAPVLGGPQVTHNLAITATYDPGNDIFKSRGKLHDQITLPAANLVNECQDLNIVIAPIVVSRVGAATPVKATETAEFSASISPQQIARTSADIPGVTTQANLTSLGNRPAKLLFRPPDTVPAAQDVTFRLTFGTAPHVLTIDITVQITP